MHSFQTTSLPLSISHFFPFRILCLRLPIANESVQHKHKLPRTSSPVLHFAGCEDQVHGRHGHREVISRTMEQILTRLARCKCNVEILQDLDREGSDFH